MFKTKTDDHHIFRCWLCRGVIDLIIGRVFNLELYSLFFVNKRMLSSLFQITAIRVIWIYILYSVKHQRETSVLTMRYILILIFLISSLVNTISSVMSPSLKYSGHTASAVILLKMVYFHQWVDSWTHKTLKGREKINLHFHIIGKRRGQESSTSKIR